MSPIEAARVIYSVVHESRIVSQYEKFVALYLSLQMHERRLFDLGGPFRNLALACKVFEASSKGLDKLAYFKNLCPDVLEAKKKPKKAAVPLG